MYILNIEHYNRLTINLILIITIIFLIGYKSPTQANPADSVRNSITQNSRQYHYPINHGRIFVYEKPSPYQFLINAPLDIVDYTRQNLQLSNWRNILGMTVLTTMLVVVDQDITDTSQELGRSIDIKGDNNIKTVVSFNDEPIMQLPTDLSSGLYFIGDGWTHVTITTSFFAYGFFTSNVRALQTSSQLAEGLIAVTFVTQLIKHITGRESPFVSTQSGGRWDLFPNQEEYHNHIPAYDAFPSGHLAAAMMAVTVISENYKEYKFIKPLGYTLMTVLAFQMLNNGVHWASDYPLGLAIGYSFGKLVVSRNRKVITNTQETDYHINSISFDVSLMPENAIGLSAKLYFN